MVAGLAMAVAAPVQAASIDFTGSFGQSLDGLSTYTSGVGPDGVSWTLTAKPGSAEFNYSNSFGLGIKSDVGFDDHEAELPEYFELSFSAPVNNVSLGFNRLNRKFASFLPYFEGGFYSVNGGAPVNFFQNVDTFAGWLGVDVVGTNITSIVFSGLGFVSPGVFNPNRSFERHGLKLASLDYDADRINVPEPASMTLLGLGFAGAGLALRRRRRTA